MNFEYSNFRDPLRDPSLETLFVLDTHLYMTDGFVRCSKSNAHYLLEAFDLKANATLYRVSSLDAESVVKTIQSLTKGSCDINRAKNEVFSIANGAEALPCVLVGVAGKFLPAIDTGGETLPTESWRNLPCDGSWFKRLAVPTP